MAFKSKERDEGLNIIIVGCGKVGIAIQAAVQGRTRHYHSR